MSDEGQVH